MSDSAKRILKEQGLFQNFTPKKWENPFPDFTLEEKIPLKLVGYARSLVKVSLFKQSYSLSLSDEYLRLLWSETDKDISRSTVQRRLNELQNSGIIFIQTGAPEKLPDGNFTQERTIHLIPIKKPEKKTYCVPKMTHQENYSWNKSNRTVQEEEKKETSFIDVSSLKKIPADKRQKPDKITRRLQIIFMKKALERIIDEEELNYRFMCLLLRQCFGSNEQTVKYYGSVLHMNLRFKPELVASTLELMIKTYNGIHKPVGFLISELQASLGKESGKKSTKETAPQEAKRNQIRPYKSNRNLVELEEQLRKNLLTRKCPNESESGKLEEIPKKQTTNPKEGFDKVLKLFKH